MALPPGSRLGPYEVASALGAGGMGEVYRAHDTKLNRDVALKVLLPEVADNPERLARFRREAQILAALNHQNIGHIYGLEESRRDGPSDPPTIALVLELVEGPTLADRIAQGPIPLPEALPIARQIAEALEAAHEQGIIHRDLKPANIKVRADGTVKVLDFGLAKAREQGSGIGDQGSGRATESPTITSPALMTGAGVLLGTAAYMSPEQARGKPADKRSDIWSFGCVLYEMLTGQRAFKGEEISDVLASILRQELDWSALPSSTPKRVRRLLIRCLDRDARTRLRDIGEARVELDAILAGVGDDAPASRQPGRTRFGAAGWVAAAVLGLAAAGLGWRLFDVDPPQTAPTIRFTIPMPTGSARTIGYAEVSPDGRFVVFEGANEQGRSQLWLRALDTVEAHPIPGTEDGTNPCWSPDGRFVAFQAGRQIRKVRTDTGQVETVTEVESGGVNGIGWMPNGDILLALNLGGLLRVPASGGTLEPFTTLDPARKETRHYYPAPLPDGRHVLFVVTSALPETAGVWVVALDNPNDRHRILPDVSRARVAQGHLLFVRRGNLMAQPFDLTSLAVTGEATSLGEPVRSSDVGGFADFSVSATGVLAIAAAEPEMRLTRLDRSGHALATFGSQALRYQFVRLSPDQRYVAADAVSQPAYQLFVFEPERNTTTPLTSGQATGNFPVWSPDGTRIAFGSNRTGVYNIFVKASSGSTSDEVLLESPNNKFVMDWSRDGRFVLYGEDERSARKEKLWTLPMTGDRKPSLYLDEGFDLRDGRFSPDGHWVAYTAIQQAGPQVFIRSFPDPAVKLQVSVDGGSRPAWRDDGRELFFVGRESRLMAVDVTPGSPIRLGTPTPLFQTGLYSSLLTYDVYRGGQQFVMPAYQAGDQSVRVVLNWLRLVRP